MSDRSPDPLAAWVVAGVLTLGVVAFGAVPDRAAPMVPAEFDVSIPGAELRMPERAERLAGADSDRDAIDMVEDAGQIAEVPPPAAGAAEIGHRAVKAPSC